jgi:hypothetical protein
MLHPHVRLCVGAEIGLPVDVVTGSAVHRALVHAAACLGSYGLVLAQAISISGGPLPACGRVCPVALHALPPHPGWGIVRLDEGGPG